MATLVGSSNMADSNFHREIGHVTENTLEDPAQTMESLVLKNWRC